jgi:hypothetical protein
MTEGDGIESPAAAATELARASVEGRARGKDVINEDVVQAGI